MNNKKIAVAVSGGIDSLYSAWLLKNQGFDLIGIHFVTGYEAPAENKATTQTPSPLLTLHSDEGKRAIPAMNHVAEQLGIPIHIIDIKEIFKEKVVKPFVASYMGGETPNPCQLCNPNIKFGLLLEVAKELGADTLATGHYVQTELKDDKLHLRKGSDPRKDQSYFLSMVPEEKLKKAIFPLGGLIKEEIKERALAENLSAFAKGESQDICFIPDDYKSFLLTQDGFAMTPGPITLEDGTEVGRHMGLHGFTVGQRRGINCPGPYPYYVLALRPEENRLIVGKKESLLSTTCRVKEINWLQKPEGTTLTATCKIRYSHRGASATICWNPETSGATVTFDEPQSAVTPGQGAVFYIDDEVIGGGWIF